MGKTHKYFCEKKNKINDRLFKLNDAICYIYLFVVEITFFDYQ